MRIVHVTDCFLPRVGGIEFQVHDLAAEQIRRGHDVKIVTSVSAVTAGPMDVRRPPGRPHSTAIRYTTTLETLRRMPLAGADVVHVHASTFSPLAFASAAVCARSGIPVAFTLHSMLAQATPLFRWSDRMVGWGSWPIAWSAVSNAAARSLGPVVGADVDVVPNGIDESWWATGTRQGQSAVRLVSVLRMARRKRPLSLVPILQDVRKRVPRDVNLRATIVGSGPQLDVLRRALASTGLDRWVDAIGSATREQVRATLNEADIFIAPAVLESFGIAALEARCAGLPVVAYAGTGVEDFVIDGVNGLLVADDRALAAGVAELACVPERRAAMSHFNLNEPSGSSWPTVVNASEDLYRRAAATTSRRVSQPVSA